MRVMHPSLGRVHHASRPGLTITYSFISARRPTHSLGAFSLLKLNPGRDAVHRERAYSPLDSIIALVTWTIIKQHPRHPLKLVKP